jgi:ubiquinone/menaquinone biosynthesis C-methylase UbiE
MVQQRERRIVALLRRYGFADLQSKTILEVGCGTGHWLREFVNWGARPENITGIDLLADRVSKARRLCPIAIRIECANAAKLPFANESFHLVLQSMVFTSILDPDLKCRVAAEMMRVVKPDGFILWYDYHVKNPRNNDVRRVKRREIHRLFTAGLRCGGSLWRHRLRAGLLLVHGSWHIYWKKFPYSALIILA